MAIIATVEELRERLNQCVQHRFTHGEKPDLDIEWRTGEDPQSSLVATGWIGNVLAGISFMPFEGHQHGYYIRLGRSQAEQEYLPLGRKTLSTRVEEELEG